jgi:tripeptide aminopeptidase
VNKFIEMKETVVDRFLWYVRFDTQSDPKSEVNPSTAGQTVFARELVEELKLIGLSEIELNQFGYIQQLYHPIRKSRFR